MRIESCLQPNCSEYVLILNDLSEVSVKKIQELEEDLKLLRQLQEEEYVKLPKEPGLGETDTATWCKAWGTWKELPEVIAFHDRTDLRWNKLRKKYAVGDGDIFETTIKHFSWNSNNVTIEGWLNEENFLEWLETKADVKSIKFDEMGHV